MPFDSPRGNPANLPAINKRYLQLNPVNASSGGVYSFRNGLPLIKFDISSSDAPLFMEGHELRLNGNITYTTAAAAPPATCCDIKLISAMDKPLATTGSIGKPNCPL